MTHQASETGASADPASGVGPIREFWTLAWPTVVTMLSYTVMQFVDAVLVAQVGPVEVAAQGNGGVWSWAVIFSLVGVLSVVNTFVSQAMGAHRPHEVARYGWAGLWLGVMAWAVVLVPVGLVLPSLFGLMGHSAHITGMESDYAQVLVFGGVVVVVGKAMSNFFFGIQRPGVITVSAIAGNVVNLLVSYALVFGRLGVPKLGLPGIPGIAPMGVVGSALGTVAGTAVEASIPLVVFLGGRMDREFGVRARWRLDIAAIRDLLRLGVPSALQQGSEIITWAIFMSVLVGHFGDVALGAGWATLRYMHLSFMPAVGFGIAVTSIVGRNIGAGRPDIAVARARVGLGITMAYMGACGVLMLVFRGPMIALFAEGANTSPETAAQVVATGSTLMVAAAFFQVFDAIGIVLLGALRGAGDTLFPGIVTVVLSWTLIVGGGWALVAFAPGLGPLGPWIAASAYIVAFSVVLAVRWHRGAWRRIRVLETPEEEEAREARAAAETSSPA
jgi:MATE family multidrug resistance protein